MEIVKSIEAVRSALQEQRTAGKSIGFVPTMGFLHEGHLSLMRRARQENDLVVVSIFVNPTQFGPNEDLAAYPRDAQRDTELMRSEKVDIAFFPEIKNIYPDGFTTYVEVQGPITQGLCGKSRPTHFRGVTTVVAKLFHIVAPDRAYFGQKDAQQAAVIKQMVRDLNFDLQVVVCPIQREADGLAMSSRNTYLTLEQREEAVILYRALNEAARQIHEGGQRSASAVVRSIKKSIGTVPDAVIDYVEVVDADRLTPLETLEGDILIALAVKFGKTRLIDNLQIRIEPTRLGWKGFGAGCGAPCRWF
jgi:pantoate--beta-alanine ligase